MKRKVIWLVVTGWIVAALLLASCAPAVVKEEEKVAPPVEKEEVVVPKAVVVPEKETNLVKWTGTKLDGTVVEKMLEKPRYGGNLVVARADQPSVFDDITRHGGTNWAAMTINEALRYHDWTRGPAGTGEWSSRDQVPDPYTVQTGGLAESWELLDATTLVLQIRKGVRWALDSTSEASRLVAGRELTAEDVVFTSRRNWTVGYYKVNYPELSDMANPANSIYVSPTDKWAVVIKSRPGGMGLLFRHAVCGRNKIFAPEVVEKYGPITNWKNVVGTGPFLLKEYVGASSLAYVRNPSYWGNDPFFPENQLPYLDGFKVLIIPDKSTQMAALRTGKIDTIVGGTELNAEEGKSLMKTSPELGWARYLAAGGGSIFMRNDTKPFDDVRVRRALALAINRQEILDLYHGGEAVMFTYPIAPKAEAMDVYIPLEQMPRSVQELFEYHPDKAKQLLTEAGYPQGFKAEIIAQAKHVDLLSVIKEYWAKIGVDLKIDVRDFTVYSTIQTRKTHTQMLFDDGYTYYISVWASYERKGGSQNYSIIDDQWRRSLEDRQTENYFDMPKRNALLREPLAEGLPNWAAYANEQVWFINLPQPYNYAFWQPWLKGYHGEFGTGFSIELGWPKYVWIDQELKKAMGR